MKKLFLVLALALAVGCSGTIWGDGYIEGNIKGAVGSTTSTGNFDGDIASIENLTIESATYEFKNNIGGAGSIGFGITSFGGDCSIVTSVLTVPIVAATNVAPTASDILKNAISANFAVGRLRVCLFYTQDDPNIPLDLTVRIDARGSKTVEIKTGF